MLPVVKSGRVHQTARDEKPRGNSAGSILGGTAVAAREFQSIENRLLTFPLRDAAGKPHAVGGISTDISERKRVEQAMRESEERARQIVDTALRFSIRKFLNCYV